MEILSYFCPFSKKFNSCDEFNGLTDSQKALTVVATIAASVFSLPLFGLGGVATFRAMVEKYSFKKLDIKELEQKNEVCSAPLKTSQKIQEIFEKERQRPINQNLADQLSKIKPLSPEMLAINQIHAQLTMPFDQMTPEKLRACMALIGKNPQAKKIADQKFIKEAEIAREKALSCHEAFKAKFEADKSLPTIDPNTGITLSSLYQLKAAIQMGKEAFPGLSKIALNNEQKVEIARLIQIILCGESAFDMPYPSTSSCFSLIELQGKKMVGEEVKAGDIAKNISLIDQLLETATTSDLDHEEHIFNNIGNLLHYFANDNLVRTLNNYQSGDSWIPMGLKGKDNGDLPAAFVSEMKQSYLKFLLANPGQVKETVAAYGKANYLAIVKEKLGHDASKEALEDSSFPEIFLEELLIPLRKKYYADPEVLKNLDEIVIGCRMDEADIAAIQELSGCEKKDIEPLARLKAFEMMLLMNQANQADSTLSLFGVLASFGGKDLVPALNANSVQGTFEFPKTNDEDGEGSFSTLVNKSVLNIFVTKGQYGFSGIEAFEDRTVVAKVQVVDRADDFNLPKAARSITPINDLLLDWQGSDKVFDFLVSKVDPNVLDDQPQAKSHHLMEKLKASQKMFETTKPDSDTFTQLIEGVVQQTRELLKVYALSGSENQENMEFLKGHKVQIVNAAQNLVKFRSQNKEKMDALQLQEINRLLSELDRVIELLPNTEDSLEVKGVQKNYFDNLKGVFSESSNPDEIKWKVKKYEAQILELQVRLNDHFSSYGKINSPILEEEILGFADFVHPEHELLDIIAELKIDLSNSNRFNQEYLSQVRGLYNEKFLPKLREMLLKYPNNVALQEICEVLYTSIYIENECMETVDLFDQLGAKALGQNVKSLDPESHGVDPFVQRIHTLNKRIEAAPYSAKAPLLNQWGNSARGQWNRDFDPNRQGNPIHVLYQMMFGDKLVKGLGMGTPTVEDKNSDVSFAPEFAGFIKAYKREGKKHLFVLNQNAVPKKDVLSYFINGDETNRSELILKGQDLKEFKGALFCILLAKNSNFYYQKGSFSTVNSSESFKDELYKQMFLMPRTESGCYIPQAIKDEIPTLMDDGKDLIGLIHTHVFQGKDSLSVEERKLFIEIYYDMLTKWIMVGLDIDSFNLTCKDAIDRGAGSNAEFYGHSAIVENKKGELTPLTQKKLEMLMMARALLVRKRAPIEERVERFAESLDFALTKADELKSLHQAVFQNLHIIPM